MCSSVCVGVCVCALVCTSVDLQRTKDYGFSTLTQSTDSAYTPIKSQVIAMKRRDSSLKCDVS